MYNSRDVGMMKVWQRLIGKIASEGAGGLPHNYQTQDGNKQA